MKDFSKSPFAFTFDETTATQIKKHYDGYIQYWSPKHGKILSANVGSLFLGHCDHQQLAEYFNEFASKLK